MQRLRSLLIIGTVGILLSACGSAPAPKRQAVAKSSADIVASIRAAGRQDNSAVEVAPLRDPTVQHLTDKAHAEESSGQFKQAAADVDQALKVTPKSPDLLQYRAELAVRLHDYTAATRLAAQSFQLGPRLGSLCARNWQTIVEMRRLSGDQASTASASKQRDKCHVAGQIRM